MLAGEGVTGATSTTAPSLNGLATYTFIPQLRNRSRCGSPFGHEQIVLSLAPGIEVGHLDWGCVVFCFHNSIVGRFFFLPDATLSLSS